MTLLPIIVRVLQKGSVTLRIHQIRFSPGSTPNVLALDAPPDPLIGC